MLKRLPICPQGLIHRMPKPTLGTVHLIFWGGGGGAWNFFEKNFLALILTKKNNIAQWHSEKNNLSPIVYPKLTYRHRQNPKFSSGSLRSPETLLTNLNCIKMPARHVKINFQTPCSLVYVYIISLFHN